MKTSSVTLNYTCDICESSKATTNGSYPEHWKCAAKKPSQMLGISMGTMDICPTCSESSDPAVILKIKNLLI